MQLARYFEGDPLMWMMPLDLHVNQKSDYDMMTMPHETNTFSACGEIMPEGQDSSLLKLLLQPVGDKQLIGR